MNAKELARILGISAASVSYALNGKPGVSTETRNKVKEAARKFGMNFIPLNSSIHAGREIYLISYKKQGPRIIDNSFDNSFYSSLTDGITGASKEFGYHVHWRSVSNPLELKTEISELGHLDSVGIILLATEMGPEDLAPLAFSPLPVVLLDNHFRSTKVNSVTIDNIYSSFAATDYLCRKRKKQPGYLQFATRITNFQERKRGYELALEKNGYSIATARVHTLTSQPDSIAAEMAALIKKQPDIADCYFAENDFMAFGAVRAFREAGYRVPEDVAVIGFDDLPIALYSEPQLTTMHVPVQYMGVLAVERLHAIARDPFENDYPQNIQVNANLVIRHSA